MANVFFHSAKKKILDGTIDLLTDTLKVMLVDSTYAPDSDDDFVDDGTANDPASHEISVTNYTPGFASASRRTLAGKSVTDDSTDNEAVFDATDPTTWTALGAGATIGGAVIYKHETNDAASQVIFFLDTNDVATNGGNVDLVFDAEGIMNW